MFLNIAACNIHTKDFDTAYLSCNEALKIDPSNIKGLYRRARALALPINSGVEDFQKALKDLNTLMELEPNFQVAKKEI